MFTVLVVLHLIVSTLLIISILMQSSKGGGLAGIGGGGQSNILSGREAADTLTKATVVLAILFAILSIGLNIKGLRTSESEQGIIERQLEQNGQSAPSLPGGQ